MNYTHQLLIAKKELTDPIFAGKVVFIFRHDEENGALGFILNGEVIGKVAYGIINAPDDIPANPAEMIEQVQTGKMKTVDLQMAGPCEANRLTMLHGYEEFSCVDDDDEKSEYDLGITYKDNNNSNEIIEGVYFGSPASLSEICNAGLEHEKKFVFLSGAACWGAGQLEIEIEEGAWEVRPATPELIFNSDMLEKIVASVQNRAKFQSWANFFSYER